MNDRPRGRRSAPRPATSPACPVIALRAQSRQWRALGDLAALRAQTLRAIEAGLAVAPVQPAAGAELSLLLTDDRRIRIVNRDWRGFDKATNVLSFPAASADRIAASPVLGDIVIAFETVAAEAEAEGKALADHFSHLVIHGLLHLLGEDHETDADAQRMEALEVAALARLRIADPYADGDLVGADEAAAAPTPFSTPDQPHRS
ncbi:MAG: rRNA maturation RNase YbeY [Bosea sp. (in: a-proteobacteria)]|uniref:rRNA maturation RNase YbeY n=1 Tax=Bosea sp. (in: a-proteobacteria) TaxID=1871050 RepID=UPI0027324738|nr:rRNA maturation RNase YbeY [Bosea sp. (in: a-proteobacteria)]MDP3258795.1 rRNA maturation RNase YbeY [Bosea sp. (in: a-proteobacteria)]MDP3320407.1 rRNA maturation RNase YbeY [Bosea sp. (in: a-proteobacteria)]